MPRVGSPWTLAPEPALATAASSAACDEICGVTSSVTLSYKRPDRLITVRPSICRTTSEPNTGTPLYICFHERLKQMYKGVPVFGSEVVRQMDGRTVISLSGRLYDNVTLDVTPQISSQAAEDAAVASAGSGANVHGEPTLGILPVEGESYKLAYRMQVRSDWDVRDIAVDALTGEIIYSRSMLEH